MIIEMLSYHFIVRALIVGLIISLCSSLLGVPLVLKRYSMLGDGLSHVSFGAMAIATALNFSPLWFSLPIVTLSAVALLWISQNSKIKGDSLIAIISTSALAIGIIAVSITTGMNKDISNYLFGSILSLSREDAILSAIVGVFVIIGYILFYPRIFAVSFDETFAKATGANVGLYNLLIAILTALTIVLGMRMMGALLISSLLIFPAISAMRIFNKYIQVTMAAALFSIIAFIIGFYTSYVSEFPTGPAVVVTDLAGLAIFSIIGKRKRHRPIIAK